MKKCTDLNSVKEVAGCLLYTDVHRVENYPFLVKHPFTDSAFAAIAKNPEKVTENKVINILESESNLNRWREYVAERIDSAESADEIYSCITKPYRLTFMKYAGQYLSEKDFAEMLCSAWITSENPNSDVNVSLSELLRMFRSADKSLLMTAEERKRLDELDDPVTVYRGVTPYNAKSVKAMSWTLDYLCEWQCIDGAAYLPQTRRRVFLVGYLDPRCAGEILPIERKGGKALSELTDHQPQGKRVYDAGGAAITQTASCGGFGGRTGLYLVDYNENSKFTDTARCITARQDSGMSHHKGEHSAVFFEYDGVYPVINPDRETVRQNGPRFRPNGAPSYCLTVVDRHGIFHRGWIRKLHPQECFRLMGFSDEQFFKLKNELGLSDSKLYKLAGNSIMVPVLVDILSRLKAVNEKYQIIKE